MDCTTVTTTNLSSTKRIPENSISERKSLIEVNRWKNDCTAVPTDSDWHRLWIRHILHNRHRIEPSHRQVGLLKPFITVQSFNSVPILLNTNLLWFGVTWTFRYYNLWTITYIFLVNIANTLTLVKTIFSLHKFRENVWITFITLK